MSSHLPIDETFERVYIVDITPSLLAIAQQRIDKNGWKNVRMVCSDASTFQLSAYAQKESNTTTHDQGMPACSIYT